MHILLMLLGVIVVCVVLSTAINAYGYYTAGYTLVESVKRAWRRRG